MAEKYSRQISFEAINNFRDLGGYRAKDGRTTAWRSLFRSGALLRMSERDKVRLKEEIGLKAVLDLTNPTEQRKKQETSLLDEIGAKYYNIPFRPDNDSFYSEEVKIYKYAADISEVYLNRLKKKTFGKQLVRALEIISDRENYPLLFHCGAGKDRTGILTAFVLSLLGVADDDIATEYSLTDPFMESIRVRIVNDPATPQAIKDLPDFAWRAKPESMHLLLNTLRQKYGSIQGYVEFMGGDESLIENLKNALLI